MSLCVPGMPCFENTPSSNCCSGSVFPCESTSCVPISSNCVYYSGTDLDNSGIENRDDLTLVIQKLDEALGLYVPLSRTITINGTTYDLSADRTWNVGVVTSISAGTGISVGGTSSVPIITNTAPDQTVTLTQGANITITGTYPNFTIAASGGGGGGWAVAGNTTITADTSQTGLFKNTFALNGIEITQNSLSSGWIPSLKITPGSHTNLTATQSFINNDFGGGTWVWADGIVSNNQIFNYFRGYTINKTTSSLSVNNGYTVFIDESTFGVGVTGNNWALGINGNILVTTQGATGLGFTLTPSSFSIINGSGNEMYFDGNSITGSIDVFLSTSSGLGAIKVQTSATGTLSFFGVTPIGLPTTGFSSATFVANASANPIYKESTFDGYKIDQIVKALRSFGLLT